MVGRLKDRSLEGGAAPPKALWSYVNSKQQVPRIAQRNRYLGMTAL
jgi:hypothetical protein